MENNLGMKIKSLRIKDNLTQQQLADKIGVSNKAVSKWENNDGVPDIENLKLVSKVFKVSIDELLANEPIKKQMTKVDISLLIISALTFVLYLMPFMLVDSFNTGVFGEETFFINVTGLNFIISFFQSLKFFNLVIVVASSIIFINAVMHMVGIVKKSSLNNQKWFSLLSVINSIIILAVMLILSYEANVEKVTFVPYLLVVLQIIQYVLYRKDNV